MALGEGEVFLPESQLDALGTAGGDGDVLRAAQEEDVSLALLQQVVGGEISAAHIVGNYIADSVIFSAAAGEEHIRDRQISIRFLADGHGQQAGNIQTADPLQLFQFQSGVLAGMAGHHRIVVGAGNVLNASPKACEIGVGHIGDQKTDDPGLGFSDVRLQGVIVSGSGRLDDAAAGTLGNLRAVVQGLGNRGYGSARDFGQFS